MELKCKSMTTEKLDIQSCGNKASGKGKCSNKNLKFGTEI